MSMKLIGSYSYLPYIIFPIFFIGGLLGIFNAFNDGELLAEIFMIVWMSFVFYNFYKFIQMVIRIDLHDNKVVILKTIAKKEYEIDVNDFISIIIKNNIIKFVTQKGEFVTRGNFDGFSDFVIAVKNANPDLVTKGC